VCIGLGQSPFPVPEVVANALRKNAHQKDYLPVKGLLDLRNAVAKHFTNTRTNTNYRGSDVVVGPGSKELLFLVQMCYDCELVIGSPSWVSYAPQAKLVGHKVLFYIIVLMECRLCDDSIFQCIDCVFGVYMWRVFCSICVVLICVCV